MSRIRRGHLRAPGTGPRRGEVVDVLATMSGLWVEQILSGELSSPVDYVQDHDEWVVLLEGEAVLIVGDESISLSGGEWILLPAGVSHRLVSTAPGSMWLAVHGAERPD